MSEDWSKKPLEALEPRFRIAVTSGIGLFAPVIGYICPRCADDMVTLGQPGGKN